MKWQKNLFSKKLGLVVLVMCGIAGVAQTSTEESLSLCGQCTNPIVFSKTGAGTSHAVAEARITLKAARNQCLQFAPPGSAARCAKEAQQAIAEEKGKVYRAVGDCVNGTITAINGQSYTLAGKWTQATDIGRGRSKWRDASGAIVGDSEGAGGLAISEQWEVLCPAGQVAGGGGAAGAAPASVRRVGAASAGGAVSTSLCAGQAMCEEVGSFAAKVTDFRVSSTDRTKILTATLRIENKLNRPLVLGYVGDSGVGIDDQGHRYLSAANSVRGIGLIGSGSFDPKFMLQAGEASEARIEFVWQPGRGEIYGTSFELSLTLREIDPVAGNQFRLGREHALRFAGLVNGSRASANGANVSGGSASGVRPPGADVPAVADACAGAARCSSGGSFSATVVQVTSSQVGTFKDHLLRIEVRFHNAGTQPLILAYKASSSALTDNLGNLYYWGHAGSHDTSVQGIGMVESQRADPQFRLAPGESRVATFQMIRYRPGAAQLGTSYTYSNVIEVLEVLPSQQIRTVREYSLNFPDLTATGGGLPSSQQLNRDLKKLGDIFKKK